MALWKFCLGSSPGTPSRTGLQALPGYFMEILFPFGICFRNFSKAFFLYKKLVRMNLAISPTSASGGHRQ